MSQNDSVVFLSAKRTPFGAFGGSMKGLSATDLGVIAAQAAISDAVRRLMITAMSPSGTCFKPALTRCIWRVTSGFEPGSRKARQRSP